jgi:hypothetical protein
MIEADDVYLSKAEVYLTSLDPRRLDAVRELSTLITQRYASAAIFVGPAEEDPEVTHITAVVDIDDPDEVADLVMDRMLQLLLDEDIPIYVIPIRTPGRLAALREQQRGQALVAPVLPLLAPLGRTAQAPS